MPPNRLLTWQKFNTFAFSIFLILPTASFFKTIPRIIEQLCKPPPRSFATRTLSTLKFVGFFGQTWMHAWFIKRASVLQSLRKQTEREGRMVKEITHISNKRAQDILLPKLLASNSRFHSGDNFIFIANIHSIWSLLYQLIQYLNRLMITQMKGGNVTTQFLDKQKKKT